jgi:hypothetical protein
MYIYIGGILRCPRATTSPRSAATFRRWMRRSAQELSWISRYYNKILIFCLYIYNFKLLFSTTFRSAQELSWISRCSGPSTLSMCVCIYKYKRRFTTGDNWIFKNVLYELSHDVKSIAFHGAWLCSYRNNYCVHIVFLSQ